MINASPRIDYFDDLNFMARSALNRIWNWLSRGVRFRNGNASWNMNTIDAAMQGLERVYNAISERFGANQADHKMSQALGFGDPSGLTIRINGPRNIDDDGNTISTGDYIPGPNDVNLYYSLGDAYTKRGQSYQ